MILEELKQSSIVMSKAQNSSYDEVNKLCQPLFKNSPIQYYEYFRFYDNGELIAFNNYPGLSVRSFRENLVPRFDELRIFEAFGINATFFSHHIPLPAGIDHIFSDRYEKIISNASDEYIYNALYLFDRQPGYYRVSSFAVDDSTKTIFNYYIMKMLELQKFTEYFESHVEQLLYKYYKAERIIIPGYLEENNLIDENIKSFINNSLIPIPSRSISITPQLITLREKDCLELIGQGYTMKNTARKLNISPRTVEQHLRNVKEKHGLNNKNQLVEIWHDLYKHSKLNRYENGD